MWMQTMSQSFQTSVIEIKVNTFSLVGLWLITVGAHVWLLVKHSKAIITYCSE